MFSTNKLTDLKNIILSFVLFCSCIFNLDAQRFQYVASVDPFIGTGGHGHVFLGANVPFGMVQAGPVNINRGWDWCSGYHYSGREILGFTHTHLSGTGIGDWGDILVLPASGQTLTRASKKEDLSDGYGSPFDHTNEVCTPGYYRVRLDRYGVEAEMTTTTRAAIHHFRYDAETGDPHIVVDLKFGTGWDAPVDTGMERLDDSTFVGHRFSKGWARDQRLFFAIRLSAPARNADLQKDPEKGDQVHAAVFYPDLSGGNDVYLKVALSPVSTRNALLNLETEIPHWDLERYKEEAQSRWNENLSVIDYQATPGLRTIFYTSLYHSFFFPSVYDDVNGDYRGSDQQERKGKAGTNYTVYSLWDTYRAQHPLLTLVQPARVDDIVASMLRIYREQGKLPVWHLSGNETNTMVGYSAVPVVVDAWQKGFRGFDPKLAYEAVKQSSMQKTDGIQYIQKMQHIPADSVNESVAKALEYAISDGCIALMAKGMGHVDDAEYYWQRSKLYSRYFDRQNTFMRGRMADGGWRTPFSPFEARHRENDYCEGNSWQYTWLVPHDAEGLVALMGGPKKFGQKLDSLFIATGHMGEEASPDISGLIGQYAHGNEPGHHIPYLYNYIGRQDRTAAIVRRIMDEMYTTGPGGLCGNEDVGQLSAWYILSALGFYQVHPADGIFQIGTPRMDYAKIDLPGNKSFEIAVRRKNPADYLIREILLNGKKYQNRFLRYEDIMKGGKMEIMIEGRAE